MYEDEAKKAFKVITEKIKVKRFKKLRKQQDLAHAERAGLNSFSTLGLDSSASAVSSSDSHISDSETSHSKPFRKLKRTLSNNTIVNFLKAKIGKQKRETKTVNKLEIGQPTEPRLVKHGSMSNDVYEKRFRDILVELNMSFKDRSFSASHCGENESTSQTDDSFEDLNSSGMKKPPGAGRRFAPPPPPKPADPNELTAYLGNKANRAPFPSPLTPPISPELTETTKTRDVAKMESLNHCSLSPIDRSASLMQTPVTPSNVLAMPGEVKDHLSEDLTPVSPANTDNKDDFNSKIGFKGFTNSVYLTPKLKSVYEPSFLSPNFATAEDDTSFAKAAEDQDSVFILDKLRTELLRQAPYLTSHSDED